MKGVFVYVSLLLFAPLPLHPLPHPRFPEVTTLIEGILENTVLNIVRESDAEEQLHNFTPWQKTL